MRRKKTEEIEVIESSGNVYADLGFSNAEEMMAKAKLAILISDIIKERKLTQKKAAEIMGVDQPKVSAILRGYLSGFTIDRLFRFLMAFGMDIVIEARPHTPRTSLPHIQVLHHGIIQERRATA
jgi:predicted XRE-type DNA-binding protein